MKMPVSGGWAWAKNALTLAARVEDLARMQTSVQVEARAMEKSLLADMKVMEALLRKERLDAEAILLTRIAGLESKIDHLSGYIQGLAANPGGMRATPMAPLMLPAAPPAPTGAGA